MTIQSKIEWTPQKKKLIKAKQDLAEATLNFGITTSDGEQSICKQVKKKLKGLAKEGKQNLVLPKVLKNLEDFIEDDDHYGKKLERSVFSAKYEIVKDLFKKDGCFERRNEYGLKKFFNDKAASILHNLQNQNNEALNLLAISKDNEIFGGLEEVECDKLEDGVSDDDKVGIATKLAGVFAGAGFMKSCISENQKKESTLTTVLKVTVIVVVAVVDVVLSLFTFGIWKFVSMIISACKSIYYFYQAWKQKADEFKFSQNLGKGIGYLINIVMKLIPGVMRRRHRLRHFK